MTLYPHLLLERGRLQLSIYEAADLEDNNALVFTLHSLDNQDTPFQPAVYRQLGG